MLKNGTNSVLVILLLSVSTAFCNVDEDFEGLGTAIVFYGKIVDQYYKPVADANIYVDVFEIGADEEKGAKNVVAVTDKNGLFVIKNKGGAIYIKGFEKDGYEFLYEKNLDRHFEYCSSYSKAIFSPDANAPLLYYVQKFIDEPAYLVHIRNLERNFPPSQSPEYTMNLGGDWIDDNGELHKNSSPGATDLKIKCNMSEDKKSYKLFFTSTGHGNGIIASDKLQEQAPAKGYERRVVVEVNIPERYKEKKSYIYVKSRNGLMYSRLELELEVRPGNLLVGIDVLTNPAQSRNLKYDKEFQKYAKKKRYDVREQKYQQYLVAMKRKQLFLSLGAVTDPEEASQATGKSKQTQGQYSGSYYYLPYR